ncbi:MAG: S-layer homology domain-containing protein [Anaerovoracaceae bacterium]|jgi:hypothetical protein
MKKRFLSILLIFAMLTTLFPVAALGLNGEMPFNDVSQGWYYDSVGYVYEKGIMSGVSDKLFSPNSNLTRGQLCQILYNMEGAPSVKGNRFTDVDDSAWYFKAVNWAATNDIVGGVGDGLFSPEKSITREQMVTILYRYADFKGYDVSDTVSLSDYSDADRISPWAQTGMQWAIGRTIVTGTTDTKITPAGTATRAQVATILMRFHNYIQALQDFLDKDMKDFQDYKVINFDKSTETNFAVLREEAVIAEKSGSVNQLIKYDEKEGIYVFSNIDDRISNLKKGDIFYTKYGSGDDEYLLMKIGSIAIDGTTATLTEGRADISDYFEYIDVDMQIHVSDKDWILSGMDVDGYSDEGVTVALVGEGDVGYNDSEIISKVGPLEANAGSQMVNLLKKAGGSASTEFEFGYTNPEKTLSLTANAKLTLEVQIRYDKIILDINQIKITVENNCVVKGKISGNLTGKEDTKKVKLGEASVPVGSTGIFVDMEVSFIIDVDASVSGTFTGQFTSKTGTLYVNKKPQNIRESKADLYATMEGSFNISTGIEVSADVNFLKVVNLGFDSEGGIEIDAKSDNIKVSTDKSVKHLCLVCVEGHTDFYFKIKFKVTLGASDALKWELVKWTPVKAKIFLNDFYISVFSKNSSLEFGWGKCPHKQYLATITIVGENDKKIPNAKIEFTNQGDGYIANYGTTDTSGVYSTYCSNGTYDIFVHGIDGYENQKVSMKVDGKAVYDRIELVQKSDGMYTIYVNTSEQLEAAIGSNRRIILNEGTYVFSYNLLIEDAENLFLEGKGKAKLVSTYDDVVLYLSAGKNVKLKNLYLGHDANLFASCSSGVLNVSRCSNVQLDNCEIYGCGVEGINAYDSHLKIVNSTIRDCSYNIASFGQCKATFENCKFLRNGYLIPKESWANEVAAFSLWGNSSLTLQDCLFKDNYNLVFTKDMEGDSFVKEKGCTFTSNGWK